MLAGIMRHVWILVEASVCCSRCLTVRVCVLSLIQVELSSVWPPCWLSGKTSEAHHAGQTIAICLLEFADNSSVFLCSVTSRIRRDPCNAASCVYDSYERIQRQVRLVDAFSATCVLISLALSHHPFSFSSSVHSYVRVPLSLRLFSFLPPSVSLFPCF